MPWVDMKSVRFEFYTDHPMEPGSEPEVLIVSEVPTVSEVGASTEEFIQIVEDTRGESGYPPSFIHDHRTHTDWGASSGGQEIVVQMMTDPGVRMLAENLTMKVAEGAALGAGSSMAKKMLEKLKEMRQQDKEQAQQDAEKLSEEHGRPAPEPIAGQPVDLDWSVMRAQVSIASAYRLEDWNTLELESAERFEDGALVSLRHKPSERRFRVRLDRDGYSMAIMILQSTVKWKTIDSGDS